MAAVPSIGRAVRVEGAPAPEADLTRTLYERYANQIFRYCLHQLGSREEAEDAVQSTFLNAFRGIKRGVVPELESAWLFKIAHNVCLSRRRTSWRRGRIESPTDFGVVEDLTPAPSRRADELIGLQDVLEQMPENQRRAILLREWQGLSYREIAEELELSQAAVETLIFRARRALASGLEQPPEHKRRVVRGADIGNVLAGLKSFLLGGGAAVKVAATVAVVSASTVVAAAPVQQHRARLHPAPKPAAQALASHASAAPSRPAASVAGPAAAFPAKAGAPARPRPRLQLAAGAFAQIAGSATPDAAIVEVPPEPAAWASTAAPTDETTSEKSEAGTRSGRFGDAKKGATSGQARTTWAGQRRSSGGDSAQQGATSGARRNGGSNGHSDSRGLSDSKGSYAEQRKSSFSVGGPTTLPEVTMPVTPFDAAKRTDKNAGPPAVPVPPIATAPVPAPSPGSSWGNDSKGGYWRKSDSGTKGGSPPPALVVAPPAAVTLPAPVQTLSSAKASLPGAASAGFQPGETPTGKGRGKWKGGRH